MTELSDYKRMVERPMIAKMQERESKLRAALKPFAALGGDWNALAFHDLPDDTVIFTNSGAAITAGEVRAARAALAFR